MTFIHPALLTGLLLAGLPILLHLIMRQKPKQLQFPAFRFLARKATANRRRMRLRHLLLLLLRIGLVALMCLALARPRILSERFNLLGDRPAAAVIIIDTSPSMEYTVAGRTRLDEAKARAIELIESLPAGSRLAVIDCSEPGGNWLPSPSAARERVTSREIAPCAGPVTDGVATAYRMFAELAADKKDGDDVPPRFIYAVTDRTPACWDQTRSTDLSAMRDKLGEPKIEHVLVDVGLDKPVDVAITELRLQQTVIAANRPVILPVRVQATGQDVDSQVKCRIEGLADSDVKPLKLSAGQSKEVAFERRGLGVGLHRAEIRLATDDALLADNVLYATFEVGTPRPVLILCDRIAEANTLASAIKSKYPNVVKSPDDPLVRAMTPAELGNYRAVCLVNVSAPGRAGLWEKLERYVADGGGLAVFPGGNEMVISDYTDKPLMPGVFKGLITDDTGAVWMDYQYQHPVIAPFRDYAQSYTDNPPRAFRYWSVEPVAGTSVLLRYADAQHRPAILETTFDRKKTRGKVLLFTSPFDNRADNRGRPWNDYFVEWDGLALANKALEYLCGDSEGPEFNFISGRSVVIKVPADVRPAAFNLVGPGITGGDALVPRPDKGNELRLPQAKASGHYTLSTPDRSWSTGFSVNAPAEEFQLLPRVPADAIASVFGPDSIIAPGQTISMKDKLDQRYRQPLELFPWLMLLLLLVFAVENYFANRFYRHEQTTATETADRDTMPT
jgi:Aerotolerance regulator N-terminal